MSLETARDLSLPDLLHMLNEKLDLERTRLRDIPLPSAVSVASLESQVSEHRLTHLDESGDVA